MQTNRDKSLNSARRILLLKSDVATKQRIDAAINAAIQAGVSSRWNGTRPPQVKNPIWDGDGVRQNGEPFGPECKGHWVFTASSKQQQAVVDMSVAPIYEPVRSVFRDVCTRKR